MVDNFCPRESVPTPRRIYKTALPCGRGSDFQKKYFCVFVCFSCFCDFVAQIICVFTGNSQNLKFVRILKILVGFENRTQVLRGSCRAFFGRLCEGISGAPRTNHHTVGICITANPAVRENGHIASTACPFLKTTISHKSPCC